MCDSVEDIKLKYNKQLQSILAFRTQPLIWVGVCDICLRFLRTSSINVPINSRSDVRFVRAAFTGSY
jgi:hypothetical protein